MCNEDTVRDADDFLRKTGRLSRRRFGTLTAGAALAMLLPRAANAQDVSETDVSVTTPDGKADCYFVHPATGKHPGVIIWPDILGLRPAFRMMGKRLAESGYSVLVVNPYYRDAASPVVAQGASFQDESVRETIMPLAMSLSAETNTTDAKAFVAFLDGQAAVDTARKIGTNPNFSLSSTPCAAPIGLSTVFTLVSRSVVASYTKRAETSRTSSRNFFGSVSLSRILVILCATNGCGET